MDAVHSRFLPVSLVRKVATMSNESEVLLGLSSGELEALADGMLAPSLQARLDDLVARSKEDRLTPEEDVELDQLLTRVDQLTLVKTRAKYTLWHQGTGAART